MGHSYDDPICDDNLSGDFSSWRSRCRKLAEVIIVTEPPDHEVPFTFGSWIRSECHVLNMFALFDELSNMFASLKIVLAWFENSRAYIHQLSPKAFENLDDLTCWSPHPIIAT
jgi:hypothetical protein